MLDLQQDAVSGWLAGLAPTLAGSEPPPPIRAIEAAPGVPDRLVILGHGLDAAERHDIAVLSQTLLQNPLRGQISTVMAKMGAARVLRILHWLSETDIPDCHAIMAALLQGDGPDARALRSAVHALTRRAVLRRMFSAERISALESAATYPIEETNP